MITYLADIPKARFLVELVRPYFDEVIVVYTSEELPSDFEEFLVRNNVRLVRFKWIDNFAQARNQYVYEARRLGCTYLMVSDSDEWPSPHLLRDFKQLVVMWLNDNIAMVRLQSMDVFIGFNDDLINKYIQRGFLLTPEENREIYEYLVNVLEGGTTSKPSVPITIVNLSSFHKPLIFMPDKGEYIWGEPHEILNINGKEIYLSYPYYYMHVKSILEIWEHALRNVFIGGGGLNIKEQNTYWVILRNETKSRGLDTWQKFRAYLFEQAMKRQVPRWVIDLFVQMSLDCNKPWSAEVADSLRWFNAIYNVYVAIPCSNLGTPYTKSTLATHALLPHWGVIVEPDVAWSFVETYGANDFVRQYIASPTSAFAVVARLYDAILFRPADRSGLHEYTKLLLRTGDVKRIAEILLNSEEYKNRIGNEGFRNRVLGWNGNIDYGETALPAKLMLWLMNRNSGSLLTIGCVDKNQVNELKTRHVVITYDLTNKGCGLPVNPWLYPLPNYQFDYVVVTPIMHLHPLSKYVATTALALTKPGGYLVLPQPAPLLVYVAKVGEVDAEYVILQRVIININV